jgi:hypothetical protein
MPVLTVSQVKENLDTVLDEVQNTFEPIIIAGKNSSAVLKDCQDDCSLDILHCLSSNAADRASAIIQAPSIPIFAEITVAVMSRRTRSRIMLSILFSLK